MKKKVSRRRFLFLGASAVAGGAAALQSSDNLKIRFLSERLAELAKPSAPALHQPDPAAWSDNDITASWLGHATVLINFYGFKILTDPVLFARVGMNFGLGTFGPMRRQACALKARELPEVDLVLLSHAHLDHLDMPSLHSLRGRPPVVTAKNTLDLLHETRLGNRSELKWGEKATVKSAAQGELGVEAFEVKHWGARWRTDTQRGYNGYVLSRGDKRIIFGGDTALCDSFKQLRRNQPPELAIMPIGAYNPFVWSHCNPEQALQMANDAGAKYILPMHHYTFRFGREVCTEPRARLEKALAGETERLALTEAGQTFVCPRA